jgi:hypothetical protein
MHTVAMIPLLVLLVVSFWAVVVTNLSAVISSITTTYSQCQHVAYSVYIDLLEAGAMCV